MRAAPRTDAAAAERAVEEAAEEELLGDRRHADDHEARGDQPEGALVGAEVLRDRLLRVGMDDRRCRSPPGRRR